MIRIAIVEDDKEYQEKLKRYVQDYGRTSEQKFEVHIFRDGTQIVNRYTASHDIIFLDIQMEYMDGMETARMIRKYDSDVILIFITNMAQYAIQGYEVEALDYVLKPVSYFAFSQELEKAIKRLKMRSDKYLNIQQKGQVMRLAASKIYYMESQGHNLIAHMDTGDCTFRGTMKEMEEQLESAHFVRCNSGYLVNLTHVQSAYQNIVLVGGTELQISRPRRKAFFEALTNFLGGK